MNAPNKWLERSMRAGMAPAGSAGNSLAAYAPSSATPLGAKTRRG